MAAHSWENVCLTQALLQGLVSAPWRCVVTFVPLADVLTREPHWLKLSASSLVLQHGSGPSSDFLFKILGVYTSPFSWKHNFIFQICQYEFILIIKVLTSRLPRWFSWLHGGLLWRRPRFNSHQFSLKSLCLVALEAIKYNLFVQCMYLFPYFLHAYLKTGRVPFVFQNGRLGINHFFARVKF